jgi:hypothetical protein
VNFTGLSTEKVNQIANVAASIANEYGKSPTDTSSESPLQCIQTCDKLIIEIEEYLQNKDSISPNTDFDTEIEEILDAAKKGTLPDDFDRWDIIWPDSDGRRRTVAHLAALYGTLPKDFDQWDLGMGKDECGWTVAHSAARSRTLPEDFSNWDLRDLDGKTVAHWAVAKKCLPASFNEWSMADRCGQTMAHIAAECGRLPDGFDQWELADDAGWSVAHEAARHMKLPKDFERWASPRQRDGLLRMLLR